MSVSKTKTFSLCSTAKYSAAVHAISGIKSLSTAGSSVVFTKHIILSKAPASVNVFLNDK